MGRQPVFNREKVLDKATTVFLKNGFQGTTIKDITKATGLQPGSIYSAFENKLGLYTEVIEHYTNKHISHIDELAENSNSNLSVLKEYFHLNGQHISNKTADAHCLLVRGLFEVPESQKELRYYVQLKIQEIESRIYTLLVKAVENNEVVWEEDPVDLARFLMIFLFGHRVLAQLKPNASTVDSTIKKLFKVIEVN